MPALVQAIEWTRSPRPALRLLDQRLLPGRTEYVDVEGAEAGWHAIRVRNGEGGGRGGGALPPPTPTPWLGI